VIGTRLGEDLRAGKCRAAQGNGARERWLGSNAEAQGDGVVLTYPAALASSTDRVCYSKVAAVSYRWLRV